MALLQLGIGPTQARSHVGNIFAKLDLPPADDTHRRELAVLAFLRPRTV